MSSFMYISKEGLEKLKADLHYLKAEKRPEISKKISEARDFGDLKENAEYHAAKEAMGLLESKITQLEENIRRAKVVDTSKVTNEQVAIYTTVVMKDLKRNQTVEYTLVSQEESDFRESKISTTSPVGKALLGKKAGEVVDIKVPAGIMKYEILEIKAPTA
ncbi:MAG: transcription elongation factor GreA [Calditrichaeota bacterium]|nr:transcription elongation factor GreA [Calditrichota bacterium]MCB0268239.1 transcription elongation factor GreA [Calditrichota bacterium]MCB0286698.1 transcription elongation factor GreA [Calditrichota bacterium]MCB0299704.1 transcription elongation factor GreA [Calditrichota bacterium]MCB9067549.1 transcription elongation factor GreA [Calditrichia bacterium]